MGCSSAFKGLHQGFRVHPCLFESKTVWSFDWLCFLFPSQRWLYSGSNLWSWTADVTSCWRLLKKLFSWYLQLLSSLGQFLLGKHYWLETSPCFRPMYLCSFTKLIVKNHVDHLVLCIDLAPPKPLWKIGNIYSQGTVSPSNSPVFLIKSSAFTLRGRKFYYKRKFSLSKLENRGEKACKTIYLVKLLFCFIFYLFGQAVIKQWNKFSGNSSVVSLLYWTPGRAGWKWSWQ